jgi:Uma2 family endonuclease
MSAQRIPNFVTEADYRLLERTAEIRHEYYNGRIYAMAGASIRHNDICLSAGSSLKNQLRDKPCRPRMNDLLLKVEATGLLTYPDVVVNWVLAHFW